MTFPDLTITLATTSQYTQQVFVWLLSPALWIVGVGIAGIVLAAILSIPGRIAGAIVERRASGNVFKSRTKDFED